MKKPHPSVEPGEFPFAVAFPEHPHIHQQTEGLLNAGGTLKWIYAPDEMRSSEFLHRYAHTKVKAASSIEQILQDPSIKLVAAAAIPNERGPLGCLVMEAGKDYFTDKCPFTSLEQLETAKSVVSKTGQKYAVFYSERLHVESAIFTDNIIQNGIIGDILHISIMGPHRIRLCHRPEWFYQKKCYGGILTDICSHQVDQFLHFSGATDGIVEHARVENFAHPDYPELEDFGEAVFTLNTGVSCHSRVDWFTPDGLGTWGDGRVFIVGTKGYLEIRKYIDIANSTKTDRIYLVDQGKEQMIECQGKTGFPYFRQLIEDCLNRTENAMSQAHAFKVAELALQAQALADKRRCKVK